MNDDSILKAMVNFKCPRCHKGNLFIYSNPYRLRDMHKMHNSCTFCNENFNPEPGFYTGAMYVNYAFAVALTAISYIIMEIWLDLSPLIFFTVYSTVIIGLTPLLFRYSRTLYLYLFVSYNPEIVRKQNLKNNVNNEID